MKKLILLGIIAYSGVSLFLLHWPAMASTSGIQESGPFLALMVLDVLFAGAAFIKLGLFKNAGIELDADDDEEGIHSGDLDVPPFVLFGAFCLNLLANAGWHGYEAAVLLGAKSVYYSIWFMAEIVALLLTFILFRNSWAKYQRDLAKSRKAAKAAALQSAPTPINPSRAA